MQNDETENPQSLFATQRPNWSNWKQVKTLKLWHAVALACDLDPYQFVVSDSPELNKMFSRRPERFEEILSLAKNSLGGGVLKAIKISLEGIEETEVTSASFGTWAKSILQLPAEFPWQDEPSPQPIREWPWGDRETDLLRKLALAANRFWRNYVPEDPSTAPTNNQVIAWLVGQGVAQRTAEVMATILRADGLPSGPRK